MQTIATDHASSIGGSKCDGHDLLATKKALHAIRHGEKCTLPSLRTVNLADVDYIANEEHCIGEGGFGWIYRGTYCRNKPVAVKTVRLLKESRELRNELNREALILQLIVHPGVVQFYGANLDTPPRLILMEYIPLNLNMCLYKQSDTLDLSTRGKLTVLLEVAATLTYLHSLDIYHGDLKPTK